MASKASLDKQQRGFLFTTPTGVMHAERDRIAEYVPELQEYAAKHCRQDW
jgi:hypothetical protein